VTKTLSDYEEVVCADFEFVAKPGERPDVVCLAWHEMSTGQTRCLWRDQLDNFPPYRIDDRTLYICFVANAELGCHLSLNWPLPANVIDFNPEFRRITNGRTVPEGKGLLGAMAYYGISSTIDAKYKREMQKRIEKGWPFSAEEKEKIMRYAPADVEALVKLQPKILTDTDLDLALHRGESVAVLALMEHRGVPIDREIFPPLTDKRAWRYVRDAMVPVIDAEYGAYVKGPDGDWHFSMENFEAYLERKGILAAWPRTEKGKLSTSNKVFENMCRGYPQLENLRQLRHARNKMRRIKLAVGADFRNRTVLWPFKSKSSRIQPKAARWIFSPATWLRSLIKPEPGMAVAYVDWSSMEFMVGACLANDPVMIEFYHNDPYLSFSKRVGAAPSWATKQTHELLRDRYKTGLLSTQYGVRAQTLSSRLRISAFEAHEMIAQHHELFAVYWRWVDDWVAHVLDTGVMWTPFGWECRTGITEFNERSIANFPVQASAADALRIACTWANRRGLKLLASIHDAILIEAPNERIDHDVALLREIMRRASRIVLNPTADGTLELRTDAKIVRYPDRYSDKRGEEMWSRVVELLAEYQRQQAQAARQCDGGGTVAC
jgi:hypothetical protein